MSPRRRLFERVVYSLPVFLALIFHAIALDRWLLAIPSAIGLMVILSRPKPIPSRSFHWYVVIVTGFALGVLIPAAGVEAGPLSSSGAAALTGVATAVALFAMLMDQTTVAWGAGWALVTISAKTEMDQPLSIALFAFLFSSLVAAAWQSRLLRGRVRTWASFTLFALALSFATAGIAAVLQRLDELFLDSVENFVKNDAGSNSSGLSHRLTLNAKSSVTPTMDPLFEVSEMTGLLRTKVMDEFDGEQWTTSAKLRDSLGSLRKLTESPTDPRPFELMILNYRDTSIPAPAGTTSIGDADAVVQRGWILKANSRDSLLEVVGDEQERLPVEEFGGVDYLSIPSPLAAKLEPLVSEWTDGAASNREKAERITSFFQKHFEYSLQTDLTGDAHPLVTLIKERRPAYCVYFASAMALMLRADDVPTRIVTGYVPGEVNPWNGKVTVRSRDAHAWVEVWSPVEKRFLAFDPTPSSSRMQVMGHDQRPNLVAAYFDWIRSSVRRTWLLLRDQPLRGVVALLLSPLAWVGIVCLAWTVIRIRSRSRRVRRKNFSSPMNTRLESVYGQYLSSLQKVGITPAASETDDEVLARVEATGNEVLYHAASVFVAKYREARFGERASSSEGELRRLAELAL